MRGTRAKNITIRDNQAKVQGAVNVNIWPIGLFTYAQKCQLWHFRLYCVKTKKIQ